MYRSPQQRSAHVYSLSKLLNEDPPVPVARASDGALGAAAGSAVFALRGLRAHFTRLGVIGRPAADLRADAHSAERQARLVELQRRSVYQRRVW